MTPAVAPRGADRRKLLVVDADGGVSHQRRGWLSSWLRPRDLVVANDAATLPASLAGIHVGTGDAIEVRLAGRDSLDAGAVNRFSAIVFGAGDYRTPTERRPPPPALRVGDVLMLGPLHATVTALTAHPRLVDLHFDHSAAVVWEGFARHGRPIQYTYVPAPLAIWDTWTSIAGLPVAFEAPSAGFLLDWALLREIRARGARFATITHAAGISSTGDDALDQLLPFDEPYLIPAATAADIADTRRHGGRIVAVGTTVVRALEHAADGDGRLTPGAGVATNRIGPHTRLRVVDAIVSGMHERGTSHFALLRAFHDDTVLGRMVALAEAGDYQGHEFGDATFVVRHAGFHGSVKFSLLTSHLE